MVLDTRRRTVRGALADVSRASLLLPGLLWFGAIAPALAEGRTIPTPKQVIYPGDIIRDGMLMDVAADDIASNDNSIIDNRAALIGKMARRTLLPGRAIGALAVANPKAVSNGAQVKLVYREGGLSIVTTALALEGGAVGDTIKVRNSDSGLTISGTIQPDGSVSVSDS
jgi:flagellar basal body P-ring formation protein FlgA